MHSICICHVFIASLPTSSLTYHNKAASHDVSIAPELSACPSMLGAKQLALGAIY